MRRILFAVTMLVVASSGFAAENQAYLGIFAETSAQKMVGMPAMPALPPGVEIPKIPGMEALLGMGAPRRTLEVRLWSPGIAPANASAFIAPPPGLKQGPRLDLELYRPKPGTVEGGAGVGAFNPDAMPKFTIKRYWGSSPTIKPGQPEIIEWGNLTPEQKEAMRQAASKAAEGGMYFYKPDWTTGYWPTEKQPGVIPADASLTGAFALTSTYTGNVAIDVPPNVNFLAPIDLTSPKLDKAPPLTDAIVFRWKPIPGLLGSHAMIFGMEGKNTFIEWTSSEVRSDVAATWDYLEMAQVEAYVKSTEMMDGKRQDVTVPAGIFSNCDMVNLMMVGYGPGVARNDTQPLPRVQTKTTLSVMLGGKMMPKMGGMGGM